ncbi:TPA: ATP-binding protein [Stenotrophomonas maltophilia]|uniref:ATP-binding protein n=1 Tax=Stenotrophomonas maltophilia TaxID=40324 RepID=UPI001AAE1D8C|nr:ATP-binding protein [Stenotrophomonas maltophilia]MBN5123606.1 ATP-binding protein [Stenotrophomonas maltophilia]MBO3002867.1 ATP-binding protein [Stenotrophomonas maltophilia]MBP1381322.1 ATP-binding protein [Stenotrophomonas maltophilia]MBP1385566.1 ATP-binding protein [Stenotrophomonas maltophilia]HEL4108599.1 ATP-binding protein [Stenotrophomonas maltophilia]
MKVVYTGLDSKKRKALVASHEDVILLLWDNWDDYTYKTTFPIECRIGGEIVQVGGIQLLVEEQKTTYSYLDKLVAEGWNGVFPIPNGKYISVPAGLTFYEQIEGHLGLDTAIEVAQLLRDASYLTKILKDEDALRLTQSGGFLNSLQRERGAIKAFIDGWKLFDQQSITIGNQAFNFLSPSREIASIELRFHSQSPLPHDINVLIGANGVGKSQLLRQIVDDWLRLTPGSQNQTGFSERPNLNQVVVVSYSPFELFPVDTSDDTERKDHEVYRYFGFRGRKKTLTESKRGSPQITLSREFPKANAAHSLLACLADDQKYGAIKERSSKLETMERVLRSAFEFDHAAVAVDSSADADEFFTNQMWLTQPYLELKIDDEDGSSSTERYLPIASDRVGALKVQPLRKHLHDRMGVIFLKNGKVMHLSSGQRLFSYIIINILGTIRRNSLLLIDEPELFLHPTLEIAFIRMLKSILASYSSKALVATHSIVTVREIPRDCVHVFEQTVNGLAIKTPPFETFGGDVQRISSYVFGDKVLSKPYEEWVEAQLKKYGTAEQLIHALGDNINEELIIQIHAMERGQW